MSSLGMAQREFDSTTTKAAKTSQPRLTSKPKALFWDFSIKGLFAGSSVFPSFMLASDLAMLIIFEVLGRDWCQVIPNKIEAIGSLMTIDKTFYGIWEPIMQEWWDKEDLLEEKSRRWDPHRYHGKAPRLRTYREILNRQQALKNCCVQQIAGLETRDLVKNMVLHTVLIFCWLATMLRNSMSMTRLLRSEKADSKGNRAMLEKSVPLVARKGELVMPRQGGSDRVHQSLRRVQNQIDHGQRAITEFQKLKMSVADEAAEEWDESDWLSVSETSEDVSEEEQDANHLINWALFSAGMSWLMVSISWEFATFYLFALGVRMRVLLLGSWGWTHGV